jgi:hypothetical protein
MGGTGGDYYPREPFLLDVILYQFLAQAGAHKLVVTGNLDVGQIGRPLGDLFYVDFASDV